MEDKKCGDKIDDDEMLPGFRFHPTEEELVGFYEEEDSTIIYSYCVD